MNVIRHNEAAWDKQSATGSEWCTPVDHHTVARARDGDWNVNLTPCRPVPKAWFGDLPGQRVLCLASGGGQQVPILAAAGASVVSFDLSSEQLAKDALVAQREGLEVTCVQGEMSDLSTLEPSSFDLIFHPVSNVFVPDVRVVWRQCFGVLRPGGSLLAGFMNPSFFLFDHPEGEHDQSLVARYRLPYRDTKALEGEPLAEKLTAGEALEFGHSLESQIGGQLAAGFLLADLYEDWWTDEATPLNKLSPTTVATLAPQTFEHSMGLNGPTRLRPARPLEALAFPRNESVTGEE